MVECIWEGCVVVTGLWRGLVVSDGLNALPQAPCISENQTRDNKSIVSPSNKRLKSPLANAPELASEDFLAMLTAYGDSTCSLW